MALAGSIFNVKQDPHLVRNVKSNVESDVDLSCSVVIFQLDFNLLPSGPNRTACAHKSATFLLPPNSPHNKVHKWQNTFPTWSFPLGSCLSLEPPFSFQGLEAAMSDLYNMYLISQTAILFSMSNKMIKHSIGSIFL